MICINSAAIERKKNITPKQRKRENTQKFVLRCLSEYTGESNQMNDIVQLDLASISSSLRKRWDNMTAAKVALTKEITSITTWVTSLHRLPFSTKTTIGLFLCVVTRRIALGFFFFHAQSSVHLHT